MTQCTMTTATLCAECVERSSWLADRLAWIRWQLRRHRTRHQLAHLPDYLLRDLGLSRFDVQHEITRPFWR